MEVTWPRRTAWLAVLLGLLVALVLFAPARWLASAVTGFTGGHVQLLNARGSFWQGQADLLLTGGEGSQTRAALPQFLERAAAALTLPPTLMLSAARSTTGAAVAG